MSTIPSPDQKPFYSGQQEWGGMVATAINGFHFSCNSGPLQIFAEKSDFTNLSRIAEKLTIQGWVTFLKKKNDRVILKIYHPNDPWVSTSKEDE